MASQRDVRNRISSVKNIQKITACMPLSRKNSPMVQPENGARYCIGAGSDAVAAMTIEYSSAPLSSRILTNCATVDRFWPMAT